MGPAPISPLRASVLICAMGSPLSLWGGCEDGRLSQQAEQDLTLDGHLSNWDSFLSQLPVSINHLGCV